MSNKVENTKLESNLQRYNATNAQTHGEGMEYLNIFTSKLMIHKQGGEYCLLLPVSYYAYRRFTKPKTHYW